ncbi:MAG: metallophosphoesterase family protein [Bryobacteraceae bacterium]|nr:metallophosphoesterase family protein [Bryobacteraceae bacterium]
MYRCLSVLATLPLWLAAQTAPAPSDQIHLAWTRDSATTITVVWRTMDASVPSTVEYRRQGESRWRRATGGPRPSGTEGRLHEVLVQGLEPTSRYEYRVAGPQGSWSAVYSFLTAPRPGGSFEAVFVADTGLDGRLDGLSTGTREVIEAVAKLNPTVILWGGDGAYYDTDKRFGTLDRTIDYWFNMVMPFAVKAPIMPTYGNHEIFLKEGYLFWADRFPTPEGFDNRRYYSFDVGDAHFVSILAADSESGALPETVLRWIDADLEKARKSGRKWLVPYLHVAPFSDGSNHPSNLDYRRQLGPIFEKHGVRLVLTAHDQSYERTFPLRGVPDKIEITSNAKDCFGASDGTVYLKVGPGGKQSNINRGFANFKTNPPPAHTAFRDNTAHHFARLIFEPQSVRVQIFAVLRGKPEWVQDEFLYTLGSCGGR